MDVLQIFPAGREVKTREDRISQFVFDHGKGRKFISGYIADIRMDFMLFKIRCTSLPGVYSVMIKGASSNASIGISSSLQEDRFLEQLRTSSRS